MRRVVSLDQIKKIHMKLNQRLSDGAALPCYQRRGKKLAAIVAAGLDPTYIEPAMELTEAR